MWHPFPVLVKQQGEDIAMNKYAIVFLTIIFTLIYSSCSNAQKSRTCRYYSGPAAGTIEHFPHVSPVSVGTYCHDAGGLNSGLAIPDIPSCYSSSTNVLDIPPVPQEMNSWCWAAVAEMILKYYDFVLQSNSKSVQCRLAERRFHELYPFQRVPLCGLLNIQIGAIDNERIFLDRYVNDYSNTNNTPAPFSPSLHGTALDISTVTAKINNNSPILAGISFEPRPPHTPQHAVLLVGYEPGCRVIINDPFPYEPGKNPYLRLGGFQRAPYQYSINYYVFRYALHWLSSILLN